jgi:hypothetical protein
MSVDGSPQMLHVNVAVSVISLLCFLFVSALLISMRGRLADVGQAGSLRRVANPPSL